jgi:hypothetical protein
MVLSKGFTTYVSSQGLLFRAFPRTLQRFCKVITVSSKHVVEQAVGWILGAHVVSIQIGFAGKEKIKKKKKERKRNGKWKVKRKKKNLSKRRVRVCLQTFPIVSFEARKSIHVGPVYGISKRNIQKLQRAIARIYKKKFERNNCGLVISQNLCCQLLAH